VIDVRAGLKRYLFEAEVLRLMGLNLLVKPIGLVTQMVIASSFGAGYEYDAYALTFFLVSFFDNSVGHVFNSVAVPFLIRLRREISRRELLGFQNALYLLFMVPVVLFMTLLFVRGDLVIDLVGPRLPEMSRNCALNLVKVMVLPGLVLLAVSMARVTLNLNKRFRVPASMPLLNTVVMLTAVLLWRDSLGIWSLVLGFSISTLLRVIILFGYAWYRGIVGCVRPAMPAKTLSRFWSLSWMILVAQVLLSINGYVDKYFASGLEVGSISSIAYSLNIVNLGVMLFFTSLGVVMFTRMTELIAEQEMAACSDYIEDNLRRVTRLVVPGALGLSLCSVEIVRVLYQRGAFDEQDTVRTAAVLAVYVLGIPALVINGVVSRIFHSLQRLRDKMWLAAQFLVTNVVGNILLVKPLGIVGLAISSTLAINLHVALSLWFLHRYGVGLRTGRFLTVIGTAYAIGISAVVVYRFGGVQRWLDDLVSGPSLWGDIFTAGARFVFVVAACATGFMLVRYLRPLRRSV